MVTEEMLQVFKQKCERIYEELSKDMIGQQDVVEGCVIAMIAGGNVLLEGVPGVGKTRLVRSLGKVFDLPFSRIQFTPDLMPADVTGTNIIEKDKDGNSKFRFQPGPVFTNILLADEINRAMPKTQSGLLESMEEKQVTMDGTTYKLEEPFMVIATQNPVETKGTFDLPEAQLDRFLIKTGMGYPTHEESVEILQRKLAGAERAETEAGVDKETVLAARRELETVYVHKDLLSYAASICEATRKGSDVVLGASPRAMIALLKVAQGYAAISGRDHVLPDDIKRAAVPTLAHRIVFNNNFFHRGNLGEELILSLLEKIPVPSEQIGFARKG